MNRNDQCPKCGETINGNNSLARDTISSLVKQQHLQHDYIILDALKQDNNPNLSVYAPIIFKIKNIEDKYTTEEIEQGDLLCDIW